MKLVKAQKKHICTECKKEIQKGEKYWRNYVEGDDNGYLLDEKIHSNCEKENKII